MKKVIKTFKPGPTTWLTRFKTRLTPLATGEFPWCWAI